MKFCSLYNYNFTKFVDINNLDNEKYLIKLNGNYNNYLN